MGTCFTSFEKYVNEDIEEKLEEDRQQSDYNQRGMNTFVLLGTKSSGKSTILQQIQLLRYDKLLESKDKYLDSIRKECISTIIYLLTMVNDTDSIQLLRSLSINNPIDLKQIGNIISNIWRKYDRFDKILSYSYAYKDEFDFNDNISYFMNNIHHIMNNEVDEKTESILNNEDIIKYRSENMQICPYQYEIRENRFQIIDVHITRKKLHYLEDHCTYRHHAILYVTPLSDYCENLKDMNTINAMQYALDDFETICGMKCFRRYEFVLFLNKEDIFRKRLRNGISLSVCFGDEWNGPDYPDYEYNNNIATVIFGWIRKIQIQIGSLIPNDIGNMVTKYAEKEIKILSDEEHEEYFEYCYDESIKCIQDSFWERNKRPERVIFTHIINATDIDVIEKVFWDCQNIVIRTSLRRGGLIP